MKRFIKSLFIVLAVICTVIFGFVGYFANALPKRISLSETDKKIIIKEYPYLAVKRVEKLEKASRNNNRNFTADVKLLGAIPIADMKVTVKESASVNVVGMPFGMKIYTDGIMIVDFTDITINGKSYNPCRECGIRAGDVIVALNGENVYDNRTVSAIVSENKTTPIDILIRRNGEEKHYTVTPVRNENGEYKIGIWIRDSSAGIGTLTFYDDKGIIAGLGHGICDVDTGNIIDILNGEMISAEITGVKIGKKGDPGELHGVFGYQKIGTIMLNTATGIYGKLSSTPDSKRFEVAKPQETVSGKAQIYTTVDGSGPKFYDCKIKKLNFNDDSLTRNFMIEITDKELISVTGGIVQGMSGSPIIQNGKLIGAVTHVFVSDSCKGYGIFAENMLETAQSVANSEKLRDAS